MKAFVLYCMISLAVVFSVFASDLADAHEGHGPGGKVLFAKHFQETLFDVTEHGTYSLEVLLDDKEYKIGKDVIGIVVHDAGDEDVAGAELTIVHKNLATNENAPGKLTVTDKKMVFISFQASTLRETAVLLQAVKRNVQRFPADFMFQLTNQEVMNLRSQIVTSSWGGSRRANPYAFTEQGVQCFRVFFEASGPCRSTSPLCGHS